jgi:hypothetical protein
LTTLVITDLDSVQAPLPKVPTNGDSETSGGAESEDEADSADVAGLSACKVDTPLAVTSNQTLVQWLPKLSKVCDLLAANADAKGHIPTATEPAKVRVAYQTRQPPTGQFGTR